jgi:hypothetical protein
MIDMLPSVQQRRLKIDAYAYSIASWQQAQCSSCSRYAGTGMDYQWRVVGY